MIGTCFAWLTAAIAAAVTPANPTIVQAAHYWAYTAAAVGLAVYLIGFAASFFLPEPPAKDEEEHGPVPPPNASTQVAAHGPQP